MKNMKKIIATVLALLTVTALAVSAFAASSDVNITVDFNSDTIAQYGSANGTCATKAPNDHGHLGSSGNGIQLKSMSSELERRTVLIPIGKTLPAGTYTLSLWVRDNPASSTDWVTQYAINKSSLASEIALSFYGETIEDNDSLVFNDGCVVKLLQLNDSDLHFSRTTEKTQSTSVDGTTTKDWYKYTATITTSKEYTQIAFWMLCGGDTNSFYAYVDDLSIVSGGSAGSSGSGSGSESSDTTPTVPEMPSDAVLAASGLDSLKKNTATYEWAGETQSYGSGLIPASAGSVAIDGSALLVQTDAKTYGLNGDISTKDLTGADLKYRPEIWNGARRTSLTAFDNDAKLPAGTYTVSIWVYNNGTNLGDKAGHTTEIALTLHKETETDATLLMKHQDVAEIIKLFPVDASDTSDKFALSGEKQKVGTREWVEYTATITTTEEYSQFAFWLLNPSDVGEGSTIKTWIDDLSIYNQSYKTWADGIGDGGNGDAGGDVNGDGNNGNVEDGKDTETETDTETEEETTKDASAETQAQTDADELESGCGSAVGTSVAVFGALTLCTALMSAKSKKRRK